MPKELEILPTPKYGFEAIGGYNTVKKILIKKYIQPRMEA